MKKEYKTTFRRNVIIDTKSKIKSYTLLPVTGDKKGAMVTITADTTEELNKTIYNLIHGNKNILLVKEK